MSIYPSTIFSATSYEVMTVSVYGSLERAITLHTLNEISVDDKKTITHCTTELSIAECEHRSNWDNIQPSSTAWILYRFVGPESLIISESIKQSRSLRQEQSIRNIVLDLVLLF
jgi:hypothetical protein